MKKLLIALALVASTSASAETYKKQWQVIRDHAIVDCLHGIPSESLFPLDCEDLLEERAPNYVSQFKNNFFLNCSKEMSSGADAVPVELAMSICSCSTSSIVASFSAAQLKSIDSDIASNYPLLVPHIETCTKSEFPKYIESHPEFLPQYIKQHQEVLQ